ncbi:MAG: hypothetical protein HY675_12355 [Chloroflexi bacterium]|nr:hypothetical protein [Chloroflexota bacterium]
MRDRTTQVKLEVLSPLSKQREVEAANAPRLATLEGKTICELCSSQGWRAEATFPVIRELLQKRYPTSRIVPYTEFPHRSGGVDTYEIPVDRIGAVLSEKGCDALIVGNSG